MDDETLIEILKEIKELKRYMKILSSTAITNQLNKVATTPERQQVWRLADGSRSNDEISKNIGVSLRTVQYFVQEAENMGLVTNEKRGYPKRIEDVIPKEWKPWKPFKEKTTVTKDTSGDSA